MSWPPTWDKPHFKEGTSTKVDRFKRRMQAKGKEDAEKQKVRRRDGYCRFPLCGCGRMRLRTEVSHSEHKGMGGNPAGDRSKADLMVLVCHRRHKDGRVAIDKGTLRWRALTARGSNGPIAWDVDLPPSCDLYALLPANRKSPWFELARETAPHTYQPMRDLQIKILKGLAEMEQ